jgi:hypothetical protein
MKRWLLFRLAFAATLLGATSCFAATLTTAGNNGAAWLTQQRNVADGSWGASGAVKYVQTSEAVLALRALNQQNSAYYGGIAWLGNHAPGNVDFTARRVCPWVLPASPSMRICNFCKQPRVFQHLVRATMALVYREPIRARRWIQR